MQNFSEIKEVPDYITFTFSEYKRGKTLLIV